MSDLRRSARNLFRARRMSGSFLMMTSSAGPGFQGIQLIGGDADDIEPERNALPGGRCADRACIYRLRSGESSVRTGAGSERADGFEGKLAVARYLAGAHQGDG